MSGTARWVTEQVVPGVADFSFIYHQNRRESLYERLRQREIERGIVCLPQTMKKVYM